MAGQNHSSTSWGAWHNLKAVAVCCGILIVVLCASPRQSRADYVITGNDGTVTRASGYWIQGDRMFLQGASEPVSVYGIKSVTEENPTEDAVKRKDELMQEMRRDMDELLVREKAIMDVQSAAIARIAGPNPSQAFDSRTRKAFLADLEGSKERLDQLKDAWRTMKLPDFSLLRMRDIKMLQLMSLKTSIEQTAKYVKTGDPTYSESARVQLGMAESFERRFEADLSSE
ncbi:MAG TPA: hypothetical protein PLA83_12995 [Deltaproteobacteria bacterium]|nr:hypothetical protein [Deltaproteobacteria bacterium]HQI01130.1 hypothetical protein [Deltaproteobacteria bacterium]HQJ08322.1 hypothetical protein [Deltaproteobacteria bacterium]